MKASLFRKIVVNGINYYQLYKIDDDFVPTEEFGTKKERKDKDFFYIERDDLTDDFLHIIYYDDAKGNLRKLSMDDEELYLKIFEDFRSKFKDFTTVLSIKKMKSVNELTDFISQFVLYQKKNIKELINRIYMNQDILASNLPDDTKKTLKKNILLHGPKGTGKKTIVDLLAKYMNIPCAQIEIKVSPNSTAQDILKEAVLSIIEGLNNTSNNLVEANCGVVFIKDKFKEIIDTFGITQDSFNLIDVMTKLGSVSVGKGEIDFGKLTFVILYDEDNEFDMDELMGLARLFNCQYHVSINPLSNNLKKKVLLSENGKIKSYSKYLARHGKKLSIDDKTLNKLIRYASMVEPGMNFLNNVIDLIMSQKMTNKVDNVVIDEEIVEAAVAYLGLWQEEAGITYQDESECNVIDVPSVINEVKNTVINQDEAIKVLVYHLDKNIKVAHNSYINNPSKYIKKILIRGETGSGKSLILESIAKQLHVPIFIADATKYTESGYVGSSIEDMLLGLLRKADGNLYEAERGILVIDEFDKKKNDGYGSDVSRGAVQNELLTLFDGRVINLKTKGSNGEDVVIPFDTSRLTIICSGAFEDLEKIRDTRIKKSTGLGFSQTKENDEDKKITYDDYVNYGMVKQLMGRMNVVIYLNKHDKKSLIDVMKDSDVSALKIEQDLIGTDDIEVEYEESFYEKLAEKALKMKIGARGIERALGDVLASIRIYDINPSEVEKIIFTGDVIDDPNKIITIPRQKENVKVKKLMENH